MTSSARVLEIGGDRGRGGDDVLVRHHHALGEAGRSRGVDEHGEIDVDARRRRRRRASALRARPRRAAPPSERRLAAGDDDERRPTAHSASASAATPPSLALRDERRGAAVVEDVGELVGLGRGIDGLNTRAGLEHGEDRDDRLPAIVQEDDDAVAARHAARARAPRPAGRTSRSSSAIGQPLAAARPARSCREARRALSRRNCSTRICLLYPRPRRLRLRRRARTVSRLPAT